MHITEPVREDTSHHAASQTAQRIFDTVARHLLGQGEQAYDERTDTVRFVYRDLRSPVGRLLLLDDGTDLYGEELEGQEVATSQLLRRRLAEAGYPIDHEHPRRVLAWLEYLHHYSSPRRWLGDLAGDAQAMRVSSQILVREGNLEVARA